MSEKIIKTSFLLRRGTSSAWLSSNPILMYGEPGFEVDTYSLKIGDGQTPWIDLPYFGGQFELSADGESIIIDGQTIAIEGYADAELGSVPVKADGAIEWVQPENLFGENIVVLYGGSASDLVEEGVNLV